MRIAIAGGLGYENQLIRALKGHDYLLIGSAYDLCREKFNFPAGDRFIGEYLTHNYKSQIENYDILIDFSENLKSKLIMNDFAVELKKNYLCLFYSDGWKGFSMPAGSSSCFACGIAYQPEPSFLQPPFPLNKSLEWILNQLRAMPSGAMITDFESGVVSQVPLSEACPADKGRYIYSGGEMADITSVSCGDQTVSISPMNEISIDLLKYKEILSGETKILKESPFFIEFKAGQFSALLFRQGRMVVKGTKDKNTGYSIYRNYFG